MLDTFSCILSAWLIHGFSACALLQVSGGCRVTEQSHCLVERGVSVAITAELVGHSRITTTQAVYTRMRGDRGAKLQAQRAALRSAAS